MRQFKQIDLAPDSQFQFTHPGKGATSICLSKIFLHLSFNSRTLGRVRRSTHTSKVSLYAFQFTHPGKGATMPFLRVLDLLDVSIHAPWEGCDCAKERASHHSIGFNSRTLGRVRLRVVEHELAEVSVSIHAPWEGCDKIGQKIETTKSSFNSRTLGRVRLLKALDTGDITSFNSRTLGRVRLKKMVRNGLYTGFNSRTLGRVRLWRSRAVDALYRFQFTHPGKGATSTAQERGHLQDVSIHAPWEGCDIKLLAMSCTVSLVSIHAPWEGCDCHQIYGG